MIDNETIRARMGDVLTDATIAELPNHYRGKVRDTYRLDDGRIIIIATDRQSAFDRNLDAVPFKGRVLTQTAAVLVRGDGGHLRQPRDRLPRPQRHGG